MKSKKETAPEAVVTLQKTHDKQLANDIRAATSMNEEDGIKHIEQSTGLLFDQQFGTEQLATKKVTVAQEALDKAEEQAQKAHDKHIDTPDCIEIQTQDEKDINSNAKQHIPFHLWGRYHQALTLLLILLFLASMAGSVVNTQVLLMTTQATELLLNPYKAWVISIIPMLLAMASKFLPNQLDNEQSRKTYKRKLHTWTIYVGITWIVCFALVTDGFLDNSEYKDIPAIAIALAILSKLLTFTQILAELLAGLCIYTAIQDQFETFQPSSLANNPDKVVTKTIVNEAQPDVERCQQQYLEALSYLDFIRVARPAFIAQQLTALSKAKRRQQLFKQQLEDLA